MSNLASDLLVGDMVDLEGDPVFDPSCEDHFCSHRSENAELVEIEQDGDFRLRLTFEDSRDSYTASVPLTHRFAPADV